MSNPIKSLINLDLKALSEPISKLIESISSAIGVLYEPTRIIRKAKAEAKANLIRAEGEYNLQSLEHRIAKRINDQEIRRQENIENIVTESIKFLPEEVSETPVDEDWIFQFVNKSQDIGNEELQIIWAAILAKEVEEPYSISLQTLNTLQILNQSDAKLFNELNNYIWDFEDGCAYLMNKEINSYINSKNIKYKDFLHLESLGLINMTSETQVILSPPATTMAYGDQFFSFETKNPVFIRARVLTKSGFEISRICEKNIDTNYRNLLFQDLNKRGINIVELRKPPLSE